MAKRYYLCDIVGDGTDENPFRPAVANLPGVAWSGEIPTGPDGRPLFGWCLVIVGTKNHAEVRKLTGVDACPDFPLDGKLAGINQITLQAFKNRMTARGLNYDGMVLSSDGYRELVDKIGKRLNPLFDVNRLDVADA